MFRFERLFSGRPDDGQPEQPKRSRNDELLREEVNGEQIDRAVDKVKRLSRELKKAGSAENVKQSYDDAINAATHVADVLEKEKQAEKAAE